MVSVLGSLSYPLIERHVLAANSQVTVTNELTYYQEGEPLLAGASVELRNSLLPNSPAITGASDETGIALIGSVPEGTYNVRVSAPEHSDFNTVFFVESGAVNALTAFLQRQLITVTWTVTPTVIPTQFVLTPQTTFVTNVPVPIIVVEPFEIDLAPFETCSQTEYVIRATNEGLINAETVQLSVPQNHPFLEFSFSGDVGIIPAQATVFLVVQVFNPFCDSKSPPLLLCYTNHLLYLTSLSFIYCF